MAPAALGSGLVSSLPPPRPKSPPEYPDLYGKRRELAKVQMLEREIGFLEEELKSVGGLQPASRSCKEVADFVMANVDPLIPTRKKIPRSKRLWKWICGMSCFNVSWICCCCNCRRPNCCDCDCNICSCGNPCGNCSMPKCSHCCSCWNSQCLKWTCSSWSCCIPKCSSCLTCLSCSCSCSCSCSTLKCSTCYPTCPTLNIRRSSCCSKGCCFPCYLCY